MKTTCKLIPINRQNDLREDCFSLIKISNSQINYKLIIPSMTKKFKVGKARKNDLQVKSRFVSNYHFEIVFDDKENSVKIRDLGSTNGTFVNGKRITTLKNLEPDSVITAGDTIFLFVKTKIYKEIPVFNFCGIVGCTNSILNIYRLVYYASISDTNTLILGKTGMGKELIARAIAKLHKRFKNRPNFVVVNSGNFQENTFEAELFGYKRGAFTGAMSDKTGLIELADKGVMFFDEIGNIPISIQEKLLRVIEYREFLPVGGSKLKKIDTKFIFATNKNISELLQKGFKEDFLFRISGSVISIPDYLSERKNIKALIFSMLIDEGYELAENAEDMLANFPWGGNVREIKSFLEKLKEFSITGKINLTDVEHALKLSNLYQLKVRSNRKKKELSHATTIKELLQKLKIPKSTYYHRLKKLEAETGLK